MSDLSLQKVKETFARLFVLCVQSKMNLTAFTKELEKSEFVTKIEANKYDDYFNSSLESIFFDVTKTKIEKDESFGVYNDAYWCGWSYFELHQRTKKSFAFLFLKLPFSNLVDMYNVYHEMDFSSLLEQFLRLDKEKTILRALCTERGCSISKLSLVTKINKATLSKYNSSDDALLKGSFQAVYRIARYFDVPFSLFVKAF